MEQQESRKLFIKYIKQGGISIFCIYTYMYVRIIYERVDYVPLVDNRPLGAAHDFPERKDEIVRLVIVVRILFMFVPFLCTSNS